MLYDSLSLQGFAAEACEMRWDQINGDRWTIPETKNGKSHVVTLHPLTLSILKKQRIISEGAYVFESTSNPGFAITGDAVTRALERLRKKHLGELATFSAAAWLLAVPSILMRQSG